MQDNIQNEITERIDNIAHEIIEAIQQQKGKQINEVNECVINNEIRNLAILYSNYIRCKECFIKPKCKSGIYDCCSMALNYMKGDTT